MTLGGASSFRKRSSPSQTSWCSLRIAEHVDRLHQVRVIGDAGGLERAAIAREPRAASPPWRPPGSDSRCAGGRARSGARSAPSAGLVVRQDRRRAVPVQAIGQYGRRRPGLDSLVQNLVVVGDIEQPSTRCWRKARRSAPAPGPAARRYRRSAASCATARSPTGCPARYRAPATRPCVGEFGTCTDRPGDQPDQPGLLRLDRPRRQRGHITQRRHRLLDPRPRLFVDRRIPVQHPADGLRRHPRPFRNIIVVARALLPIPRSRHSSRRRL